MKFIFISLALVTLAGGIAALLWRNLIHCALSLTVAFAGLAGLYLLLGAEFVGFAQILVYVGAVAILIVFAILLTRSPCPEQKTSGALETLFSAGVAAVAGTGIIAAAGNSVLMHRSLPERPATTVQQIGEQLMSTYVLPLEVVGLLLTAALIGGVILAVKEKETRHE